MAETAPELHAAAIADAPSTVAGTQAAHTEHADPTALGLTPGGWVGVAMLVFLLIVVWKGALKAIAGGLDSRIAAIKEQLDEAKTLRAEAEALREEYVAKIANAEKDAEAMLTNAQHEADAILEKAEADSKAMVERRKRMAEDTIAAAEREAIEEVRNRAASAATSASRSLIARDHGPDADRTLADQVIAEI